MRKKSRLSSLVKMTMSVIGALFVASCTSDEFFGIEADYGKVDYSTMNRIALSKEYVEYQKQLFLASDAMNSIDTTKKVMVEQFKGKTLYAYEEVVSIEPLLVAYKNLVNLYPEYENTSVEEKQQISRLSIYNNKSLRSYSKKYLSATPKSKSCSPESLAYQYADASGATQVNSYTWNLEGYANWYADDFYATIINAALSASNDGGAECGGMFFSDGSGILNEDFNATPVSMTLYWHENASFQPISDFHVHPNGNLDASLEDIFSWAYLPWNDHYIMSKSGCERYSWVN